MVAVWDFSFFWQFDTRFCSVLDYHASVKQVMPIYKDDKSNFIFKPTSFLRVCYLLSVLRPMLPLVGGFAISSDGYFFLIF